MRSRIQVSTLSERQETSEKSSRAESGHLYSLHRIAGYIESTCRPMIHTNVGVSSTEAAIDVVTGTSNEVALIGQQECNQCSDLDKLTVSLEQLPVSPG